MSLARPAAGPTENPSAVLFPDDAKVEEALAAHAALIAVQNRMWNATPDMSLLFDVRRKMESVRLSQVSTPKLYALLKLGEEMNRIWSERLGDSFRDSFDDAVAQIRTVLEHRSDNHHPLDVDLPSVQPSRLRYILGEVRAIGKLIRGVGMH